MKKSKLTILLPALLIIASCSKDSPEEYELSGTEPATEMVPENNLVEVANPNMPEQIQDVYFAGQKIPVEKFEGEFVYQGDILLPTSMIRKERVKMVFEKGETPPANKSVGRTSAKWPNNTVYYDIDSDLDSKQRVYDAIAHWESNTSLDFVQRASQANYIYFVPGSGCSSYIGMIGGRQEITLSSSCSTGNAIHEIGHAVGLWHEQSRVDRGDFITIKYNNIESGREHNFLTYQDQGFDGEEYTNSLDFSSIMMYGSYSFSNNGNPTIVKKDGSTFRIQRNGLSSGDQTGIENMYPSSGGEITYQNGQYYVVHGLKLFRIYDQWYFRTTYGWKLVEYYDGFWWYA